MTSVDGSDVLQLTRWRDQVLEAYTWEQWSSLDRLALRAVSLAPSADALAVTGAGKLLDSQLWSECRNDGTAKNVAAALVKWKASANSKKRSSFEGSAGPSLLKKPRLFKESASHFKEVVSAERAYPAEQR